jgi:serine/threonine-protein kinase
VSALEGTLIGGRYRLEAQVGSGGMSTVHRANDEKLQRPVAVKLMHRSTAADADHLERFRREAKSVANLSDPNLVGVIDAGDDDGRPYIVLEYVDGETLKARIKRNQRLDVPEAIAYAIEISRGLSAANDGGIIHRDVKPQNVLIDQDGRAKVTDFGIARTLDEDGLTADGRVIGTTDYVSPEQALGEQVGAQSDIYSLGIVLFEMLTGKVPFSADSPVAVAMCHVREPMPDVQMVRPEVSATVAAIVDKCTAKDAAERYSSFRELTADLESALALEASRSGSTKGEATSVLETLPPQTKAKVPLGVRWKPSRTVVAGLIIALSVAAGVVAWQGIHRGTGVRGATPRGLAQVPLAAEAAHPYDPFGDSREHNSDAHLMLDGDRNTVWASESYSSGSLEKGGVGVAIDSAPGVAARAIGIKTPTPGFTASIWAADGNLPSPSAQGSGPAGGTPASGPPPGWSRLSPPQSVSRNDTIRLAGTGKRHRWYLIWITTLPPNEKKIELQEVTVLR